MISSKRSLGTQELKRNDINIFASYNDFEEEKI